jgi:hypothetical protein
MRIGTGVLILTDLLIRSTDITAFYTDQGIWPRHMVEHLGWQPGFWSIHMLSGSYAFIASLFVLHFIFASLLVIGYRSRFVSLCLWLLTISLHNRNIYILQGGDDLLRLLLFWGIFLPWGSCYSVDARRNAPLHAAGAIGSIGYLALLASVYFFSVLHKTSSEWWSEGTALYYSLSLDSLRSGAGDLIYRMPSLLKLLTWLVIGLECLAPVLILWPAKNGAPRRVAFAMLLLLHIAIGFTMNVGIFFLAGIVSAIGLLPPGTFKAPGDLRVILEKRPVILSRVLSFFLAVIIAVNISVNLGTVSQFPYRLHSNAAWPVNVMRLDQRWGMFSPGIIKQEGWLVTEALDEKGNEWDIQHDDPVTDFEPPERMASLYKNDRWRKLAENMRDDHYSFLRPLYGNYLLREWNRSHPERQMKILNLYFMEVTNLPDYGQTPPKKILYCVCYAPQS